MDAVAPRRPATLRHALEGVPKHPPQPEPETDTGAWRQISLRLPAWMIEAVKTAAEWEGIEASSYYRSAVRFRLRKTARDRQEAISRGEAPREEHP